MSESSDITQLLVSWREGDAEAGDALMRAVYEQLRALARRHLNSEREGHTMQTTDLVHEAYMRLAGSDIDWKNRVHFFAVAARAMRRILVDHARSRLRAKRGAGAERVPLDDLAGAIPLDDSSMLRILALDDALTRLAEFDERKSRLVELTFFGGATREEAAAAMEMSLATLHREMKLAKAWLHANIVNGAAG